LPDGGFRAGRQGEETMSDEVKLCVEILDRAIEFEEEGMRFFTERSEGAPSALERNVFRSLAKDEAGHKAHLVKLRTDLLRTKQIDSLTQEDHEHRTAREIFEKALEEAVDPYQPEAAELEILKGALEVERRGYRMYSEAAARMDSPRARDLFRHLASEEQNHYQLIHNTYEYMSSPEDWNGFDESPMLDGG
jgi:rubrerythrin